MSKRLVSADGGAMLADCHYTRRDALGALAGATVLPIPKFGTTASLPDPVFAAIERHRAAWAFVGAMARATDEVAAMRSGRKVTQAEWDAYDRASAIEQAAFREWLDTPPTSAEGMRAAIRYMVSFDDGYLSEMARPFLVRLLTSAIFAD